MYYVYDFDDSDDEQEEPEMTEQESRGKQSQEHPPKKGDKKQKSHEPICVESWSRRYVDGQGVEHSIEQHQDNRNGITHYKEMRRLGDRAMTLIRETGKDGKVTEHETRTNLKDEEVARFQEEWNSLGFNNTQAEPIAHNKAQSLPEAKEQPPRTE